MSNEARIKNLEETVAKLKKRLNHVSHPPRVNEILDYIREKGVTTMQELRQKFPLYGGNLSSFYNAIRDLDPEFVIVYGCGRIASMVVAHTPDGEPATLGEMAVHAFSQTRKRGQITLYKIMENYNLTEEEAKQVYDVIIKLFKGRISHAKRLTDRYSTPIKRLY